MTRLSRESDKRPWRHALAAAFVFLGLGLGLCPTVGLAQEVEGLPIGSRVRICTQASEPNDHCQWIGTLQGADGEGLHVLDVSSAKSRRFPRESIRRLDVSLRRGQRLQGALTGLMIGALVGGAVGLASGDSDWVPAEAKALVLGAFASATAGVLGALASPGEKWREVPVNPGREGGSSPAAP